MRRTLIHLCAAAPALLLASCGSDAGVGEAQVEQGKEQVRLFVLALEIYRLHTGSYPPTDPGLLWLRAAPPEGAVTGRWRGPYLTEETPDADPWGRLLLYERSEDGQTYTLKSLGPDASTDRDDLTASDLMPRLHEEIAKLPPIQPSPSP